MKFIGLMLLRDEEDVMVQNLEHVLSWIDALYIIDLGSTDATWEIVQQFAARDKRVVPFKSAPIIYNDNLRAVLFDQYRRRFSSGDWIMKIDADEFYHVLPPVFVRERLRPLETAVWLQWYFFRLTNREVDDYETGRVDVLADRRRPIVDRRRHYKISEYAEPRMFKYRRGMQWPENNSFPFNAGLVARERIPIRHYPHRDPLQMERRFKLRAAMMKLKAHAGGHWKLDDWRAEIVNEVGVASSSLGIKGGLAGENGIDTGQLLYCEPGSQLREQPLHNHLASNGKRLVQRLIHPAMLPLLDATRKSFSPSFEPKAIPSEVQRALE